MRKGWLFLIMFVCTLLLITSGIIVAADIPTEIVIDGKNYKKDIKGPVNFKHAKHAGEIGITCTECHHEYKDGKNTWVEGQEVKNCAECHDPLVKKEPNIKKLMKAYHDKCRECHKEKIKEGLKAPDNKCESCHFEEKATE